MIILIFFAIFSIASVSSIKFDVDALNKQSFHLGTGILQTLETAESTFQANVGRFQNLKNISGDFMNIANLLFVYGNTFNQFSTETDELKNNLSKFENTKGKAFIDITKNQYEDLLNHYQNMVDSANSVAESLYKLQELLVYMVDNFNKIKIINGQIILPKNFIIYFNNAILSAAAAFNEANVDIDQVKKVFGQMESNPNMPKTAEEVLKQMVNRYDAAAKDCKQYSTLFYQLEASALTYTGNLNTNTNTSGGRCTSENLEKLLTKINHVVINLIPVMASLIGTYTDKANLY